MENFGKMTREQVYEFDPTKSADNITYLLAYVDGKEYTLKCISDVESDALGAIVYDEMYNIIYMDYVYGMDWMALYDCIEYKIGNIIELNYKPDFIMNEFINALSFHAYKPIK